LGVEPAPHHRDSFDKLRNHCGRPRFEYPTITTNAFQENGPSQNCDTATSDRKRTENELFGKPKRRIGYYPIHRVGFVGVRQEIADWPIAVIESIRVAHFTEVLSQDLRHVSCATRWLQTRLVSQLLLATNDVLK
jgi:hypothetical protein